MSTAAYWVHALAATGLLARASGVVFQIRPLRGEGRLPLWLALPLIAMMSAGLWLALFWLVYKLVRMAIEVS